MEGGMQRFGLAMVVALALTGTAARAQVNDDPTGPQPLLPTEPLSITADGGKVYNFTVEMAATPQEQATGEMFRTNIPANAGMLFVWPQPADQAMWMENCPVPEDMVFIAPDGTILAIAENTVPYSTRPVSAGQKEVAVLELQGGITATDGISVGDKVVAKQFGGS
jgi:hypothetical protein